MSLFSVTKHFDRESAKAQLATFRREYKEPLSKVWRYCVQTPGRAFALGIGLILLLVAGFYLGSNISGYARTNAITPTTYVVSTGIGQEEPLEVDNQTKKIATSWVDMFQALLETTDPLFDDFLGQTPRYVSSTGADIAFSTGSVRSPKPLFDTMMGLSTSIIVLFLALDAVKVVTKGASLRNIGKRYLIGFILLFSTGWLLNLSIDFANTLTTDVFGATDDGRSILGNYIGAHLDELAGQYEAKEGTIWGWLSGEDRYGPIETLQAYVTTFVVLLPTILMFLLLFLIILQMAWRWMMLYVLTPFAPLAQVFYIAPFGNGITRKFWTTWISNLIHLPIFLLCYKLITDGLLSTPGNISITHTLIFIVALFLLWRVNSQIGSIFTELGGFVSNFQGEGFPDQLTDSYRSAKRGAKEIVKRGKNVGTGLGYAGRGAKFAGKKTLQGGARVARKATPRKTSKASKLNKKITV